MSVLRGYVVVAMDVVVFVGGSQNVVMWEQECSSVACIDCSSYDVDCC